jgi:hypothetical protein
MDDRASMVEALHERVLAVLGESDGEPVPGPSGPLFGAGRAS